MPTTKSNVFDFGAHEVTVDRALKERAFQQSFMSDAKWTKCFRALAELPEGICVTWRLISGISKKSGLPTTEDLRRHYIHGTFDIGPLYYKEIEWLDFPIVIKRAGLEQVPAANRRQDVSVVKRALEANGKWQLEETANSLRLYGYKA